KKLHTIKQITAAAKYHKLLVLAHANSVDMYQQAMRHDIDIVVHGLWNWSLANSTEDLPMEVKTVLDDLRSKAIGFMPTQRIVAGLGELMLSEILEDPEFPNVTPEPLLAWYRTAEAQWFRDELVEDYGGLAPEHIATIIERRTLKRGSRTIRYLNEAGHSILLGSDSPGSPSYVNQPGLNTYRELQMMASIGIPLDDIFKAATINNARQFGISKDYGSVETGKVANLLILQENPLVEIEAWNRIEHVVLHGVAFFRDEFAARH
ncbi:MAG: amidohydrolase family protein, partial [Gammaproteobacteria bacterium]|nr:amidohydrolase family protein [Gammaproteobacteria bacterium]